MKNLLLYILTGLLPFSLMAQDQKATAAAQGLEKFRKIIFLQPQKERTVSEADTANLQLGAGIQTALVSLDRLKTYKAGQPAAGIITDINEFVYPIVNGQTKKIVGSMTLSKTGELWSASRF